MEVGGQRQAPAVSPPGKTRYPLYRRLGGSQGPLWNGEDRQIPTATLHLVHTMNLCVSHDFGKDQQLFPTQP